MWKYLFNKCIRTHTRIVLSIVWFCIFPFSKYTSQVLSAAQCWHSTSCKPAVAANWNDVIEWNIIMFKENILYNSTIYQSNLKNFILSVLSKITKWRKIYLKKTLSYQNMLSKLFDIYIDFQQHKYTTSLGINHIFHKITMNFLYCLFILKRNYIANYKILINFIVLATVWNLIYI